MELRATYRLQLTPAFGFDAARELVPYLRDLGISHLYLSPSLQARPGSTHGYDVIDPSRLSDALGGREAFERLAETVAGAGMGIVLDVVPNHMAADDANRYWADAALRERFFDVDHDSGPPTRWRRFFDVDELAGIRIEDAEVFAAVTGFTLTLVRDGLVDGLRVDHPDGLADPVQYLHRLGEGGARRVWVEKILASDETVPDGWAVSGTVGYEFLNDVCALFVDPAGEAPLTALWEQVSGDVRPFGAWALDAKLEQARGTFAPEVERLARASEGDVSPDAVALALSVLPVYRTYTPPAAGEFLTRFQQTTPAIMAKGVEDTAFYRYCRLLALNDVGGDPGRFGLAVQRFHADNAVRAQRFPEGLLTTMTHDAKRSGDVRMRIAVLSCIADEWAASVVRWISISERFRSPAGAPDEIERYLIFQTLVGAWPIAPERLDLYLSKALREAKRNTSWVSPNLEWEAAVLAFTAALVEDAAFRAEFDPLVARIAALGRRAALGALALKLTAPGVPDIYQGDELELLALVDPDNRRPVDWEIRQTRLAHLLGGGHPGEEFDDRKLWLTARLLGLRARRPEPFAPGATYEPVEAGSAACAYVRGGEVLCVVALRDSEGGALRGTPGGRWREILTGDQRTFGAVEPLDGVVGEAGVAVFERV